MPFCLFVLLFVYMFKHLLHLFLYSFACLYFLLFMFLYIYLSVIGVIYLAILLYIYLIKFSLKDYSIYLYFNIPQGRCLCSRFCWCQTVTKAERSHSQGADSLSGGFLILMIGRPIIRGYGEKTNPPHSTVRKQQKNRGIWNLRWLCVPCTLPLCHSMVLIFNQLWITYLFMYLCF